MKDRANPLEIPQRAPFVVVELPDREDHDLMIPSLMAVSKIVKQLDGLHVAALMSIKADTVDPGSMISLFRETGPELAALLGALIGKAWHHKTKALETPAHAEPLIYGEQCYEELHAAGYSFEELILLGLTIVRALWDQSQFSTEVGRAAAFFSPLLARTSSPGWTSGSATSEIPGDSTN